MVNRFISVNAGNDITTLLVTQALQPLGCDGGPPAGKHLVFDLDFNPPVCLIVSPSISYITIIIIMATIIPSM